MAGRGCFLQSGQSCLHKGSSFTFSRAVEFERYFEIRFRPRFREAAFQVDVHPPTMHAIVSAWRRINAIS